MFKGLAENLKKDPAAVIASLLFVALIMCAGVYYAAHAGSIWEKTIEQYREDVPTGAPVSDRLDGATEALSDQIDDAVPARDLFVEMYGGAHKLMGRRSMSDPNYGSLFITDHGQISHRVVKRNPQLYATLTGELAKRLESYGIPFLYVAAPFKLPAGEQQIPESYVDYSNENLDTFLADLERRGIAYYDLREDIWNSGMTQEELFFKTDHHWTAPAALYATGCIERYLCENYGFEIDEKYSDPANFTFTTYPDSFIGSAGRRVGRIYGGTDDFTLVAPDFETDITLYETDYGATTEYSGTFEDAVLKIDEYITPEDKTTNRYAVYHGDDAELVFENNLIKDGPKIMIIKDSFGLPVYSFLSLGVSEVRALDMRLFEGDVAEYAEEYRPDVVLILYNADSLSRDMFRFKEKKLW